MIKDVTLKAVFIPLLGILLPVITGLVSFQSLNTTQLIVSNIFFLLLALVTWQGTAAITARIRYTKAAKANVLHKILFIFLSLSCYTALITGAFSLGWQKLIYGHLNTKQAVQFTAAYTSVSLFVGLIYEILFSQKELELDNKIVDQLDLERQYAEMNALKNELDPHFIFNSLTTLSHLISNDSEKARLFINKLAQSYKYLLLNKDRDMITLDEELRFIDNYFFLLQIRHDHKLKLEIDINGVDESKIMILPCALQILVENAIKHNYFTEEEPLVIQISLVRNYLHVVNNIRQKPYKVESTYIGLKNLKTRYKLTCNRDVMIHQTKDRFQVKLPLIKPTGL